MATLNLEDPEQFVSFSHGDEQRMMWIFIIEPTKLGFQRRSSVGSLVSGKSAMRKVNMFDLKGKLSQIVQLSSKYSRSDVNVRFRMHLEPHSVSRWRMFLVLIVDSTYLLSSMLINEISSFAPYYIRGSYLEKGVSIDESGQVQLNLKRALGKEGYDAFSVLVSLQDISLLTELIVERQNSLLLPPWFAPQPSFLIGRDRYGRDCFTLTPRLALLGGRYLNLLPFVLSSGFVQTNLLAILPTIPSGISQDQELPYTVIQPEEIGFNLLHIVLNDLNLGLKIFTVWGRILRKRISPQAITDFLYGIVKSINASSSMMNFNSFSDILSDDEIRTRLNIVQYDQFIDAFGSVLSLPLLNHWKLKPLQKSGYFILDGKNFPTTTRLLLASFFANCQTKGLINGVVVIPETEELPYSYPLSYLLDDIGYNDLIILSSNITHMVESPFVDLVLVDESALPRNLKSYSLTKDEILAFTSSADWTVIDTSLSFKRVCSPTLEGSLVNCRVVNNIYDLFEEDDVGNEVESLTYTYSEVEEDTKYSEFLTQEANKWVVLLYFNLGTPQTYEGLFSTIGRKVKMLKNTLQEVVDEGRVEKRNNLYSLSAHVAQLIQLHRNHIVEISAAYADFVGSSKLTQVEELIKIREWVQESNNLDTCIQWLKNIYHFLGIIHVDSFYRKRVLALYIATKSTFRVFGKEIMSDVLQEQIINLLLEVETELQLTMSSKLEDIQETVQLNIIEAITELDAEDTHANDSSPDDDDAFTSSFDEINEELAEPSSHIISDAESGTDVDLEEDMHEMTVIDSNHSGDTISEEGNSDHPSNTETNGVGLQTPSNPPSSLLHQSDSPSSEAIQSPSAMIPSPSVSSSVSPATLPSPPSPKSPRKREKLVNGAILDTLPTTPPVVNRINVSTKLPVPNTQSNSGRVLGMVKFLKPNEIAFPGCSEEENPVYPSCVLGWSKIEAESFLVHGSQMDDLCIQIEEESLRTLREISDEWYLQVGRSHPKKKSKEKIHSSPPQKIQTSDELLPLDMQLPDEALSRLQSYFEDNIDTPSEELIRESLLKFFLEPVAGKSDSSLSLEEIVEIITKASGNEGAKISTLDLTNEFALNISLWKKYTDVEKRRKINEKIGQKFLNALQNFRYNQQFSEELRKLISEQ